MEARRLETLHGKAAPDSAVQYPTAGEDTSRGGATGAPGVHPMLQKETHEAPLKIVPHGQDVSLLNDTFFVEGVFPPK